MSWNPSDFSPGTMDNIHASVNANANANADADANVNTRLQQPSPSTATITTTTTNTNTKVSSSSSTPQYTTVGSIYHPQAHPLQPPTRRGRTVKSLFPYRNESTPATHNHHHPLHPPIHHHQYSPLQQNFDRAMSPVQNRHHLDLKLDLNTNPIGVSISDPESRFAHPLDAGLHVVQLPDKQDDDSGSGGSDDDDDDDIDNDTNMNHEGTDNSQDGHNLKQVTLMNFKTLTNLASYPNPMQKTAQKVLSSHRPLPTSASPQAQQRPLPWRSQATNTDKDQKTTAMGARSARSDPLSVACMPQADSVDEHVDFNRSSKYGPDTSSWPSASTSRNSPYGAVLSKGPGAPAPLTAGPPGQRLYKRPTIETTANISQSGFQRPQETEDNFPMPSAHNTGTQQQRPAVPVERQPSPAFGSEGVPSAHPIPHPNKSNGKVVDTLTAEEASVYYPNGLPPDFNRQTAPVCSIFPFEDHRDDQFSAEKGPKIWAARMAKAKREFHSGNLIFNKEFDMAVAEKNSRDFARAMGSAYEPKGDQGKVINRKLNVKEASALPIETHALHLVTMTYQTLAMRFEQESSNKIPKFS
ncbi:hypothetical protein F4810DRAFT_679307 [Camillea tinctor]|nr:hypothetical protein F4810DRAFT_679307 [Camillea tinctor]